MELVWIAIFLIEVVVIERVITWSLDVTSRLLRAIARRRR